MYVSLKSEYIILKLNTGKSHDENVVRCLLFTKSFLEEREKQRRANRKVDLNQDNSHTYTFIHIYFIHTYMYVYESIEKYLADKKLISTVQKKSI